MRSKLFLLVPLAALLVACGATSTGSPAPKTATTPTASSDAPTVHPASASAFVITETVNASTYTPKGGAPRPGGPTGEPADGDVWAFSSLLQRDGTPAGTDHVTISFGTAGTALVDAVETLPAGRIVGHGTAPFQPTLAIPVISGTGAYAGATGTVTIISKDNSHNNLSIALR